MTLRTYLAARIDPDMAKAARRYFSLRSDVDEAWRWLAEFDDISLVMQWLRDNEGDRWRPFDEPPKGKLPSRISDLREMLRKQKVTPDGK